MGVGAAGYVTALFSSEPYSPIACIQACVLVFADISRGQFSLLPLPCRCLVGTDAWPFAHPLTCNAVSLASLRFPVALWPVWGWWTIPILFVLGMAMLMSMHFVPS